MSAYLKESIDSLHLGRPCPSCRLITDCGYAGYQVWRPSALGIAPPALARLGRCVIRVWALLSDRHILYLSPLSSFNQILKTSLVVPKCTRSHSFCFTETSMVETADEPPLLDPSRSSPAQAHASSKSIQAGYHSPATPLREPVGFHHADAPPGSFASDHIAFNTASKASTKRDDVAEKSAAALPPPAPAPAENGQGKESASPRVRRGRGETQSHQKISR